MNIQKPILSKRSGESDSGSERTLFERTRIRLAVLYTLIIGVIVIVLSLLLYSLFAGDIHEDMSSVFPPGSEQVRIINQHKRVLGRIIILTDAVLFVIVSAAGYVLAGATLRPIQENYRAQKRFIADASHDLRTPLTALAADLDVNILDTRLPLRYRKLSQSYRVHVRHMTAIIEDLLTIARFESRQIQVQHQRIEVGPFAERCAEMLRAYAQQKHVSVRVAEPETSIAVSGDPELLSRGVLNILKNAIDHAPEKSDVVISIRPGVRTVEIAVRDSGPGISPADLPYIFERFYRGSTSGRRKSGGTGLGLSIAKMIAELHDGNILVKSTPGMGTTMTLIIPRIPYILSQYSGERTSV